MFDLDVEGPGPYRGPAVVAPNHFSHLDPVVAGIAHRHPIRYLAVDELFGTSKFFDGLTEYLGIIPLPRSRVPLHAMRLALAHLDSGGSVGVFPEGVRVWRWGERPPKPGAAWLAQRAGVPMLPIAIAGTDEVYGRGARRFERLPISARRLDPIFPRDYEPGRPGVAAMTGRWEEVVGEALASMR